MTDAIKDLPDDPRRLKQLLYEMTLRGQELTKKVDRQAHEIALLKRWIYGRRSERVTMDPDQQRLFDLAEQIVAEGSEAETPSKEAAPAPASAKSKKSGHGRQKIPADLPRQVVRHEVPADECVCKTCSLPLEQIGEESSESLEYKPSQLFVLVDLRPKWACKTCQDAVVVAPTPVKPVEKGLAGPGLLAHVVVSKFQDHLPLTRQSDIFERSGVHLARQTLCGWVDRVASLLEPIHDAVRAEVLRSSVIHSDDTTVPLLDPERDRTRTGRLWVYVGDQDHPGVSFDYRPDRSREGPMSYLKDYRGFLQADAYAGYDALFKSGSVVEVACWAHARRKFFEAKDSDMLRASVALAHIRGLYDVEDVAAKEASASPDNPTALIEARLSHRSERSPKILADLRVWMEAQRPAVLERSPLGEAIKYALNQWSALTRYVTDGRLAIDNNLAEQQLRRVAVGRKNWTFAGSDVGAKNAAILYSLLATCRRHKVDPWAYIRDVLIRVSTHPASQVDELMPHRWHKAAPAGI